MVRLWDGVTGKPLGEPLPQVATTVLLVSPDGRYFVAAGDKMGEIGHTRVWDLTRRQPVGRPLLHAELVQAAAFRADSRAVLTGSLDKTARLWDAATGAPLGPPLPHDGPVVFVAFSPDGKTVLTRSQDGMARLWELVSGKLVCPPLRHDGRVLSAVFRPDGRTVLTGGEDKLIRQWSVPEPVGGTPEQVLLSTQVLTGMELDPDGLPHMLSGPAWQERRQRSEAAGPGP
jgi:WD40 repeat protein